MDPMFAQRRGREMLCEMRAKTREMRQMSPAQRTMDPMFASMSDAEFEEARRGSSRTGMVFGASWVESKWRAVRRDAS